MLIPFILSGSALLMADPAAPVPRVPAPPAGLRLALTDGQLFVPEGFRPAAEGCVLTLHLHGAAWAAEKNVVRVFPSESVHVTVILPGLSAVYTRKFSDPAVFRRILEEAGAGVARLRGTPAPLFRRVVVTSFSAGFGGVRELLKDPMAYERMDALVMADSIHAGLAADAAGREAEAAHMEGFLRYARDAVSGRKCLVISHSEIRPETYASTTETADYLLRETGGVRQAAAETWAEGLLLRSLSRRGRFEVYGFAGETAADHMRHLHGLWTLLQRAAP